MLREDLRFSLVATMERLIDLEKFICEEIKAIKRLELKFTVKDC